AAGGLRLGTLARLGLGNILPIDGVPPPEDPEASWGRMTELSPGKDSTTGHWELMGCPLTEPFPTYPGGFPREIMERFKAETGVEVLGNRPASGTAIIEELGEEHIRTGRPIVYTSADSVFQIAAHEEVIPVRELYRLSWVARRILAPPHHVARVIARPFTGTPGHFTRTKRRRDFSLPPPGRTLLDALSQEGLEVVTVGKIHDLFASRGITKIVKAGGNDAAMRAAVRVLGGASGSAFLFINLIDFDMLWGHRRDTAGYARGLERFDAWLERFMAHLVPGTLLAITSDHGCDPTMPGSDHTREYVPVLATITGVRRASDLGTRATFGDLGATIAEFLGVELDGGSSFLDSLER
ncbi:MAG TPA: phosphopentomutase, partial [Candidatus Bathyarchaeia archaeon]|nr:phosphopentomutase [Candidatus Bathyarchaeia archaeon]